MSLSPVAALLQSWDIILLYLMSTGTLDNKTRFFLCASQLGFLFVFCVLNFRGKKLVNRI